MWRLIQTVQAVVLVAAVGGNPVGADAPGAGGRVAVAGSVAVEGEQQGGGVAAWWKALASGGGGEPAGKASGGAAGRQQVPRGQSESVPGGRGQAAVEGAGRGGADGARGAEGVGVPPAPPTARDDYVHAREGGLFELHVRDQDITTVLRLLSIESQRNIIASPGVQGRVSADLYDVSFEEALEAILASQNLRYRVAGKFVYVMTPQEWEALTRPQYEMQTRVFELNYLAAADAAQLVTPVLSADGTVAVPPAPAEGVESGPGDTGGISTALGEFIIVRDRVEVLEQVASLLKQLDRRPRQVLIEATILRASLRENNDLGIDFTALSGVDFQMIGSVSQGVQNITPGIVSGAQLNETSAIVRTDFTAAVPQGGLTFGIIKNNVAAFIRALEDVTDVTVLANPKILALNKQRGEVIVGRRDGYLTTTVTETAAVQTVEFLETGTQLIFRPYVTGDGYVRMEIHPKDSSGGLTPANLPFEETTEAISNVLVRDGHTILIGGLFREGTTSGRSQIPFLGGLPGAGMLFGSQGDSTTREEVIILLTVHVLKDTPVEQEYFDTLAQGVERYRAAGRSALLGIGRERLAQAHYRWALQHLEAGRLDEALRDLDMCLYYQSRFEDALRLKERLLERRIWETTGMQARAIVLDLIHEAEGGKDVVFGRPIVPWPPEPTPDGDGQEATP